MQKNGVGKTLQVICTNTYGPLTKQIYCVQSQKIKQMSAKMSPQRENICVTSSGI
jgi:hypothetical protein